MVRPWRVRFHQDINGLANAFSNITFKYLMVSSYRPISWCEGMCKGITYHSKFTADRGGATSGTYVVHVFSTSPTATPVAAAADTAALASASRPPERKVCGEGSFGEGAAGGGDERGEGDGGGGRRTSHLHLLTRAWYAVCGMKGRRPEFVSRGYARPGLGRPGG